MSRLRKWPLGTHNLKFGSLRWNWKLKSFWEESPFSRVHINLYFAVSIRIFQNDDNLTLFFPLYSREKMIFLISKGSFYKWKFWCGYIKLLGSISSLEDLPSLKHINSKALGRRLFCQLFHQWLILLFIEISYRAKKRRFLLRSISFLTIQFL